MQLGAVNVEGAGTRFHNIRLLPDVSIGLSTLEVANKIYVVVSGSSPLVTGTATNDATEPKYSVSPREVLETITGGDATAAATVAASHLALRKSERKSLAGLKVPLRYGLGIERGTLVHVYIPRAGIDDAYAVRRVEHDFGSNTTTVDVGEYAAARDEMSALVGLVKQLAKVEKEAAV
jgi:hypothetical protein